VIVSGNVCKIDKLFAFRGGEKTDNAVKDILTYIPQVILKTKLFFDLRNQGRELCFKNLVKINSGNI
jgi:hypothetical protein